MVSLREKCKHFLFSVNLNCKVNKVEMFPLIRTVERASNDDDIRHFVCCILVKELSLITARFATDKLRYASNESWQPSYIKGYLLCTDTDNKDG